MHTQQEYRPSYFFRNGHTSTIYMALFRKVYGVVYTRERLELADGDFLDLDWSYAEQKSSKLVVVIHGLEGDSQRPYILGSARAFNAEDYDVCALNLRGCSGESNRLYRSYHSGATEDVVAVMEHIVQTKTYQEVYLKGFSLGGNLILKYLGEGHQLPAILKAAVAVSTPCDLYSSLVELLKPKNFHYALRFKWHLVGKLREKQQQFPDLISDADIRKIKTLKDFDDVYTSKAHGFRDALDYYAKCSSLPLLEGISIPTLILNAQNDTFLGPSCYPDKEVAANPFLELRIPRYGGHVGFTGPQGIIYNERLAVDFFRS